METTFRLEQLILTHAPDKMKQRGLFLEMEKWSRGRGGVVLERHKMSRLYQNEAASISFDVLDQLCDYLSEECDVPEKLLPQCLFDAKEQHLLDLFRDTDRLRFPLGARTWKDWGPYAHVMAIDSVLQSEFTGLVARHLWSRRGIELKRVDTVLIDAPRRNVKLTTDPSQCQESRQTALRCYRKFRRDQKVSMVATGSAKVSGVVEQIMASMFAVKPYEEPQMYLNATDRTIPVFFRYRETDPQPASCFGGVQVSADVDSDKPGVYYEDQNRDWKCLPCDDRERDVAMIAYERQTAKKQLCFVCGGFSSRATHFLTQVLGDVVEECWPPQIETDERIVGLFLVRFRSKKRTIQSPRSEATFPDLISHEVVRLDDEVVGRRIA